MAEAVEISIALLAKDAASAVLSNVGTKLESFGKAGDVAKFALAGLTAGLGAAVFAGADFARAAANEQQGIARLDAALKPLVGDSLPDLKDAWEGAIAGMEKTTAFSDGEMRDSLSLLVAETQDADEAWKRLPIAMDFARGANIDLATASKLLGKVTDETTSVLGRYGIHVEKGADATKVLEEVQKRFSGQSAAFAETATGKWQIFNNELDNLKEDIGSALLPAFTGLAEVATGAVDAVRSALQSEMVQGAIHAISDALGVAKDIAIEFFGVLTGSAPDAGAALTNAIGPDAAKLIMGVLATIRDAFRQAFAIITTVIDVFKGDAAIGSLVDTVQIAGFKLGQHLQGIGEAAQKLIGELLAKLADALPKIAATLLEWAGALISWIAPQIPPLIAEMLKLLKSALDWIAAHAEDIGSQLAEWGGMFGSWIAQYALPALAAHLPDIVIAMAKFLMVDAPQALALALFNFGKGVVSKIADGIGSSIDDIWSAFSYMLRQALSRIDFWVGPFHVSGTSGISVSMPSINLPFVGSFAEGGRVPATGLALVHKDELITPADSSGPGGAMTFVLPVVIDGREVARATRSVDLNESRRRGTTLDPRTST